LAVYIHVDDFGFFSMIAGLGERARELVAVALRALGFQVTYDDPMRSGRYVGFRPVCQPARWEPSPLKVGGLSRLIDHSLQRSWVAAADLHAIVGIFIWFGLLWRPCLSIPSELFRVLQLGHAFVRWTAALRQEARWMRDILPFVFVSLDKRAAPVVLSQDAAGPSLDDFRSVGLRFGAWCLAAATPPPAEVAAVLSEVETIGRAGLLPTMGGGPPDHVRLMKQALDIPLIHRTLVPTTWATNAVPWVRLLARRWRSAIDICHAELKAGTAWVRILARLGDAVRGFEFLGLGDNQGAVGISSRGRSPRPPLNAEMRVQCAYEAIGEFRMRQTWTPTWAQPADGGTRPSPTGRLSVGRVLWAGRRIAVFLGRRGAVLGEQVQRLLDTPVVVVRAFDYDGPGDFVKTARRVCRLVESNEVLLVWLGLAPVRAGSADIDCHSETPLIIKTMIIASRGGAAVIMEGVPSAAIWSSSLVRAVLSQEHAQGAILDQCSLGGAHRQRIRLEGTLSSIQGWNTRCPGGRFCRYSYRTSSVDQPASHAGSGRFLFVERFILAVAEAVRRGAETGSAMGVDAPRRG